MAPDRAASSIGRALGFRHYDGRRSAVQDGLKRFGALVSKDLENRTYGLRATKPIGMLPLRIPREKQSAS